jgi:hypothetical protein
LDERPVGLLLAELGLELRDPGLQALDVRFGLAGLHALDPVESDNIHAFDGGDAAAPGEAESDERLDAADPKALGERQVDVGTRCPRVIRFVVSLEFTLKVTSLPRVNLLGLPAA